MKVIQIAIERGPDIINPHVENTYLWALTDEGRIYVRIKGEWEEIEGPKEHWAEGTQKSGGWKL